MERLDSPLRRSSVCDSTASDSPTYRLRQACEKGLELLQENAELRGERDLFSHTLHETRKALHETQLALHILTNERDDLHAALSRTRGRLNKTTTLVDELLAVGDDPAAVALLSPRSNSSRISSMPELDTANKRELDAAKREIKALQIELQEREREAHEANARAEKLRGQLRRSKEDAAKAERAVQVLTEQLERKAAEAAVGNLTPRSGHDELSKRVHALEVQLREQQEEEQRLLAEKALLEADNQRLRRARCDDKALVESLRDTVGRQRDVLASAGRVRAEREHPEEGEGGVRSLAPPRSLLDELAEVAGDAFFSPQAPPRPPPPPAPAHGPTPPARRSFSDEPRTPVAARPTPPARRPSARPAEAEDEFHTPGSARPTPPARRHSEGAAGARPTPPARRRSLNVEEEPEEDEEECPGTPEFAPPPPPAGPAPGWARTASPGAPRSFESGLPTVRFEEGKAEGRPVSPIWGGDTEDEEDEEAADEEEEEDLMLEEEEEEMGPEDDVVTPQQPPRARASPPSVVPCLALPPRTPERPAEEPPRPAGAEAMAREMLELSRRALELHDELYRTSLRALNPLHPDCDPLGLVYHSNAAVRRALEKVEALVPPAPHPLLEAASAPESPRVPQCSPFALPRPTPSPIKLLREAACPCGLRAVVEAATAAAAAADTPRRRAAAAPAASPSVARDACRLVLAHLLAENGQLRLRLNDYSEALMRDPAARAGPPRTPSRHPGEQFDAHAPGAQFDAYSVFYAL